MFLIWLNGGHANSLHRHEAKNVANFGGRSVACGSVGFGSDYAGALNLTSLTFVVPRRAAGQHEAYLGLQVEKRDSRRAMYRGH